MSLRNYNVTKMSFSKRHFLIPIIFIVFVLLFYLVYNDIKEKTINEFNHQQLILAQAASQGITYFFQNYQYELNFLSQHKCIIDFNDDTKVLMTSFYNNHKNLIEAVTRVDSRGKILFTYPYNQSAIGQDISYQKHIRQVLATHQTVISDVFMSVQGYFAVALHVPVFKGKEFKGSIAILIQLDKLGKQYFEKIKSRETNNAWLLSEDGIEIFCLIEGHTGKSFLDLAHKDSLAITLMEKIKKENQGTAKSIHNENNDNQQDKFVEKYMVFYRIPLGNTYWTILISYNEEEIYAALNSFRNRLIIIFTVLFIVMVYYFYSLTKVRTILNEETQRKKAEKTLYDSEERFKKLFYDHSAVKLLIDSETGNITDANKAASKFYGWTIEELKRMKIFQINILPPDEIKKEMESARNKEKTYFEFKHLRADGSIRDVGIYSGLISLGEKKYLHSVIHDITSRKQAEEVMRKIEREKETILDSLVEHVIHEDIDMKILWANKAACESAGLTREQLVGHYCYEIWPKRSEACPDCPVQKAMKTNQIQEVEKSTPDGKTWFIRGYPQQDEKGNIVGGIEVTMDITERKLSDETLKQSQLKYKQLFDDDLTGNFIISLDGTIELCNLVMAKIFGFDSVNELMKSNISEFYKNIEDREKLLDLIREKKKVERYEQEHITRDGRVIILLKNVIGEFDENGELIRLKGYMFDDTERKRAEETLRDSEEKFRNLVENINEVFYITNKEGKITYCSPNITNTIGFTIKEILNNSYLRFIAPTDYRIVIDHYLEQAAKGESDTSLEFRFRCKDGKIIWAEQITHIVRDTSGNVVEYRNVARDITERKRTEEELKKLSRAVEQSPASVVITNAEGDIEYVNTKFCEVTGYYKEEVSGKNPRILKSDNHDKNFYTELWNHILSGKDWQGEMLNKKKNGELYWESSLISPLVNTKGEITNYIAVKEDITEKKKMIDDLIIAKELADQSNKLKDAFIANMSHEIRTPLNGILGLTSLIKDMYSDLIKKEDEELFIGVDQSSERIIRTIDMILNYSRIQTGEFPINPEKIDLSSICRNLISEYMTTARKKMLDLSFENKFGDAIIVGDEYSITQAISNLIDNAIKYTNKGFVKVKLYKGNNDERMLDISDSGIGISEEYLQHIFEPYQQEQMGYGRAYEGIGLGLSMVKNFLNLNNATISIDSKKGKGTTFTINFGKSLQHSAEKITEVKIDRTFAKQEKQAKPLVLIVEDDAINQMTIIRFIKDGYNTLSTDSSDDAIELLKNNKVDMILMDISIKGSKNGLELTKELKASKEYLHIPIIGVTAHAFESDRNNALEAGCDDYISKPFSKNLLLDTIAKFV